MANRKTAHEEPRPALRIGADADGTFTALVMVVSAGATCVAKVLSVPKDPSRGTLTVFERLAGDPGTRIDACARVSGTIPCLYPDATAPISTTRRR